ncbi:PAS domain S-box protein [Bacteriovorax stolpii]|uniref:histidine kinase n=1 Tax=Bacteriovorax stolpii TaxID=960 RepID=A0A2K9NW14_BACTC|nr:ATP-binding protein [Bacteriovorax stolpii]AUN99708.1 hypothetical protein C0V70_16660 [Bacteriovorax stolpii]QDK40295.1 PAS domain S-box protein [Bacteriovorax stolpii]TDP51341.1 PAS domain S-box-containing protein [Bacteriovorax stolpii]
MNTQSTPDFRLLFESSPGLFLVFLPDAPRYTIVAASDAYTKQSKVKREEIVGKGVFDVFPENPDEMAAQGRKLLVESFKKVMKSNRPDKMDILRYDIKNDTDKFETHFWLVMNSPVLDMEGKILYIINQVEDVTNLVVEKQGAEMALKESEKLFKLLVENLPIGVWLIDKQGHIFSENPAAIKIWGGDKKIPIQNYNELQGWVYETGKKIESHEWASVRALEKGEICLNEVLRIKKFDGTYGVILNSAAPIKDERGQIIGALVQNQDIAEQKKYESEQKFQLNVSRILAESLELDTNKLGKLLIPNFADCCVFYTTNLEEDVHLEFVAHKDSDKAIVLEEFIRRYPRNSKYFQSIKEVLFEGKPIVVSYLTNEEFVEAFPDSKDRSLYSALAIKSFISVPVVARGKSMGAVTLCFNDSGRRFDVNALPFCEEFANALALALDKARLYKEAREAIGIREDVLAMVSHDLQNPLSVIMMSLKAIQKIDLHDEKSKEKMNKATIRIKRSSELMQGLIARILDFAKIQAGTFSIDFKDHDPKMILEEFIESARLLAEEKCIKIINDIDDDLPHVLCDKDRFLQVLSNLIGNAIKFTQKGGKIIVHARRLDHQILFSIEDTGSGMSEDQLPHIFDRFWQVEHSSKHGVGLGLAIAKGIVEAHNGKIWVDSEKGVGTNFHFLLPIGAMKSDFMHSFH